MAMQDITNILYTRFKQLFPNASLDEFINWINKSPFKGQIDNAKTFVNRMRSLQQGKTAPQAIKSNVPTVPNTKANVPKVVNIPEVQRNVPTTTQPVQPQPKATPKASNSIANKIYQTTDDIIEGLFGNKSGAERAGQFAQSIEGQAAKQGAKEAAKQGAKAAAGAAARAGAAGAINGIRGALSVPLFAGLGGLTLGGGLRAAGLGALLGAGTYFVGKGYEDERLKDWKENTYNQQVLKDTNKPTDQLVAEYYDKISNNKTLPKDSELGMAPDIAPTEEAPEGTYTTLDKILANDNQKVINKFNQSHPIDSLPALPDIANVNLRGNTVTPVNEAPTSANDTIQAGQAIQPAQGAGAVQAQGDGGNQTIDPNTLSDVNTLSAIVNGAQRKNALPYIGATPEEVEAYTNALEQLGERMGRQQLSNEQIMSALNADIQARERAGALNMLGAGLGYLSSTPQRNWYNPFRQTMEVYQPGVQGQAIPLGDMYTAGRVNELDKLKLRQEFNDVQDKSFLDYINRVGKLQSDVRTSQITGLPLGIVQNMEAKDYINYLNPMQTGANTLMQEGIKGAADIIKQNATASADLNQTLIEQYNANKRAQLQADMRVALQNMDSNTKIRVAQQLGLNAQEVEKLKQQDPNAEMKILVTALQAGAFMGDPVAQDAFAKIIEMIYQDNPLLQEAGNNNAGSTPKGMNTQQAGYWVFGLRHQRNQ